MIDDDFPGRVSGRGGRRQRRRPPGRRSALGGGTCAWFENPSWKKRVVTTPKQTPGIISSATADLDGDGKAEIAIAYEFAMNEPTKGKLVAGDAGDGSGCALDAHGRSPTSAASTGCAGATSIGDQTRLDTESSSRRSSGRRPRPRLRPGAARSSSSSDTGADPKSGRGRRRPSANAPSCTGSRCSTSTATAVSEVLAAEQPGRDPVLPRSPVRADPGHRESWSPGAPGDGPKRGASEVHVGRLNDGRRFLATVEPWHGTEVAVYLADRLRRPRSRPLRPTDRDRRHPEGRPRPLGRRRRRRRRRRGLRRLPRRRHERPGLRLRRQRPGPAPSLDPAIAAQDLRGGDLDGDGTPDVVAIGGKTHNVVLVQKPCEAMRNPCSRPASRSSPGESLSISR